MAERIERRTALVLVVATSMATSAALALLASLGALEVWHLAAASFINGICWAADNPVRRMMIGDVIGPEGMSTAMAIDAGTNNASRVLGPSLGGILLANFGIASVFWLGVGLYVPSLVAALQVRFRSRRERRPAASIFTSMREGLAWLSGDQRMIGIFLITIYFNVFGWPFTSMIPVIATDSLHLDPKGAGMLASSEGIGGLIGAVVVATLARPHWHGRIYVVSVAAYFAMVITFAAVPSSVLAALALLGSVGFFVLGIVMLAVLALLHAAMRNERRLLEIIRRLR
jgi:MFS family permease